MTIPLNVYINTSDKYEKISHKESQNDNKSRASNAKYTMVFYFFAQCVLFIITRLDMRKY